MTKHRVPLEEYKRTHIVRDRMQRERLRKKASRKDMVRKHTKKDLYKYKVDWFLRVWRRLKQQSYIILNDKTFMCKYGADFHLEYTNWVGREKDFKREAKRVLEKMIRDGLLEEATHKKLLGGYTEIRYYFTVAGMSKKILLAANPAQH